MRRIRSTVVSKPVRLALRRAGIIFRLASGGHVLSVPSGETAKKNVSLYPKLMRRYLSARGFNNKNDHFEITTIAKELIPNAVHYGNKNDPLKRVQVFYRVSKRKGENFFELYVRDQGDGMSEGDIARVEKEVEVRKLEPDLEFYRSGRDKYEKLVDSLEKKGLKAKAPLKRWEQYAKKYEKTLKQINDLKTRILDEHGQSTSGEPGTGYGTMLSQMFSDKIEMKRLTPTTVRPYTFQIKAVKKLSSRS